MEKQNQKIVIVWRTGAAAMRAWLGKKTRAGTQVIVPGENVVGYFLGRTFGEECLFRWRWRHPSQAIRVRSTDVKRWPNWAR